MTPEERRARNAERTRKWRAEHPGYHNAKMREFRAKHPDKIKEINKKQLARIHANPEIEERWKEKKRAYFEAHRDKSAQCGSEWQKNNRDKMRTKSKRWYRKNRDEYLAHLRAKRAIWREQNRQQVRADQRRQYHANPVVHREKSARRRRIKSQAQGSHTNSQWLARVAYYGWRCRWCHCELTLETLTMDHVIPLSKGGSDWSSNLVPACSPCNCKKHAKLIHRTLT